MPAPALLLAVPLLIGTAAGAWWGRCPPGAGPLVACCWLALCLAFWRRRPVAAALACVGASLIAGAALGGLAARSAAQPALLAWYRAASLTQDDPVALEGRLRQDAAIAGGWVGLTLDVDRASAVHVPPLTGWGGVRLAVVGNVARVRAGGWRAGRRVRLTTSLREPIDYRDPGVPSDRERLAGQGIALLGTVKSGALVEVVARGSMLSEAAAALRAAVRRAVAATVGAWSARSAGVVTAILIGDRTGLDPDDERRLQEAGTYHVIAISGGNVALLSAMLLGLARVFRVRPRASAAAALPLLAFYGYVSGLAPSVQRATLAGVGYLAARFLDHRASAVNLLAVAAAAGATAAPLTIFDGGFVLSFGATLGILLAADRLAVRSPRPRSVDRIERLSRSAIAAARALFAATVCAEVALLPVSARLFGRISVAGLLLNFLAIPLMSIVQTAGFIAVTMWPVVPLVARAFGGLAHLAAAALVDSARLVDVAPWMVQDVGPPAWWFIAAWYGAWLTVLTERGRRRQLAASAAGLLACLLVLQPSAVLADRVAPPPAGWSRVVFLDVGQGDAILVQPADSLPMLVDAGGALNSAFDVGRRVTVPALRAFGVRRLGVFAFTHGDPDHVGGASAVLRAFAPREVWEGVPVPRDQVLMRLRREAGRVRAAWREVRTGAERDFGSVHVRVLHPQDPDWERPKVRNDDSIVLEVTVGRVAVVLPGDISREVEPDVASHLQPAPFMIVKAPHHGSATSSSPVLLAAARPRIAIMSAGRGNHFGHPAPVVVDRYLAAGARVFRTDQDGAIVIDTDGRSVVVWTWNGRRERFD